MRIKESWTIDEDLSKWVRNQTDFKSSSDFVNDVLRDAFNNESNVYKKIEKNLDKIRKIEEENEEQYEIIKKVKEEGNKKEREEAEDRLRIEREKKQVEEKELTEQYRRLVELGFWEELKQAETLKELDEIGTKVNAEGNDLYLNFSRLRQLKERFQNE